MSRAKSTAAECVERRWAAQGTFSAPILRAFCQALDIDAARAVSSLGADPAAFEEPEGRVPLTAAFQIFDEAPERTGIDTAGLVAARGTPPGALGLMDLLARSCATIGETLERVGRYYPLIDDRTSIELVPEGGVVRVVLRDRTEIPAPRAGREYLFGILAVRWKELTGQTPPVLRASFTFPAPGRSVTRYRDLFGPDVRFAQPVTELLVAGEGLQAPVRTADPIVLAYLEAQAEAALVRLPQRDAWFDGTRRVVMRGLAARQASLSDAARQLAMSPRSLQRRLREADTSYQELVDSVRRELAVRWVLDGVLATAEIADRLDFSEAASFHRAFKRWTGDTPRAYRERLRGEAPPAARRRAFHVPTDLGRKRYPQ